MYRLRDLQFAVRYYSDGHLFKTKKEILETLASYHDIDFTGVRDNDEPYADIYEFLKKFKNDTQRLNWLLDYGQWEIEKVTECCHCPEGKEYLHCGCDCHKKGVE